MDKTCAELAAFTIFFEAPFWVGVYERTSKGSLTVCKVTFGKEPKDYEVYDFLLKHFSDLKFSPAVESAPRRAADSPKRRQREAQKQLRTPGVGTRSQQALALQREAQKTQRQQDSRQRREKHRGH